MGLSQETQTRRAVASVVLAGSHWSAEKGFFALLTKVLSGLATLYVVLVTGGRPPSGSPSPGAWPPSGSPSPAGVASFGGAVEKDLENLLCGEMGLVAAGW